VLAPDAVLFGATVLGESGEHSWMARRMLHAYNRRGAFDNLGDSEEAIHEMLARSFKDVQVSVVGSIAMFEARGPRLA
jgi:hypothetical protein